MGSNLQTARLGSMQSNIWHAFAQVKELLAKESVRLAAVDEALHVLQEAGDPRAFGCNGTVGCVGQLSIDVSAANGVGASSAPMRISPRVSSNRYSSSNILMQS